MFQLRLLGGFAIQASSGTPTPALPLLRAEAALAVLAVCGDLGSTRDRLIALLWPESDEVRSRHGLRGALSDIRRALGPNAVRAEGDLLWLDPTVVESDVRAFEQALSADRREDAVRAYRGPLLDGFHVDGALEFERWLDGERTRLARECVEALVALAERAEASAAWRDAAGWWARAVEQDPLNSHFVSQHMQALAALGDRANAIKVAEAHVRRLRDELDLEPDPEVLARIERIRRGELVALPDGPVDPASARPAPSPAAGAASLGSGTPQGERRGATPGLDAEGHRATQPSPIPVAPRRWRRPAWVALAAIAVVIGVHAVPRELRLRRSHPYPRTAIAVLPFENLSADPAHAYIARGLHDELLTQLAKVAALQVIGRTSVRAYEGTTKSLRRIGEELQVGSIVEATVQVVADSLRVIVHLVDAPTQMHLWDDSYDRALVDVFAVESDIAQRVLEGVGATLTAAEASAISAVPTGSAEAYQLYLQGRDYWRRPGEVRENLEIAQRLYERALALDSTFALAHAALSLVHGDMFVDYYDGSLRRLAVQEREAYASRRLEPELPQTHLAMAALHYSRHEYDQSLNELRAGLRGAPNDPELWQWLGFSHRRLGHWDSVFVAADNALRLDPRNVDIIYFKGYTLAWVKRYREAITAYRQVLALAPDFLLVRMEIGWAYGKWLGEWDTLRVFFRGHAPETLVDQHLTFLLQENQPDTVLALLRAQRGRVGHWAPVPSPDVTYAAMAHLLRGDSSAARAAFETMASELQSLERTQPDDYRVHGSLGIALAYLGRRTEALREAQWLERSDAYREDRFIPGEVARTSRASILVRLGDADSALAELDRLLALPGYETVHTLVRSPYLRPIRHDPRFQALLAKYADHETRTAGQ